MRVKFAVSETVSETLIFTRPAEVSFGSTFLAEIPFVSLAGDISTATSTKHDFSYGRGFIFI